MVEYQESIEKRAPWQSDSSSWTTLLMWRNWTHRLFTLYESPLILIFLRGLNNEGSSFELRQFYSEIPAD